MKQSIQVAIDVICPWCFIVKRHLDRSFSQSGTRQHFDIEWLPYELDPAMPGTGAERKSYRSRRFGSLEKSEMMDASAREAGAKIGIQFRYDLISKTPNTLQAHRLIWLAGKTDIQDAVVDAIFTAYFLEGKDIGDVQVLTDIALQSKMDAQPLTEFLSGSVGTPEVKHHQEVVQNQGLNGVPFFLINGVPQAGGFNTINQIIKGVSNAN